MSSQTWHPAAYAANGRFVTTLGTPVLDLLNPQPGERILDLGCGDGALTQQIAATGAHVTGLDSSPAMLEAARARGLTVRLASADALPFHADFDAVFSNAALHWVPDAEAVLACIQRALTPGGRFVAELGGHGNIAAIRTALQASLAPFGLDAERTAASFFPSAGHYAELLQTAGFTIQSLDLIPRPTPLPGGPDGMALWLNTFRNGVLNCLAPGDRAAALAHTIALLRPILADPWTGHWTADYVRLRLHATR